MVNDRHIQTPVFTSKNVCSFTGKERDAETGYSYFGARYYDSDLSGLFLSVDPMSDKYPSISPYSYCAWNPLRLVDPDGNKIRYAPGTSEKFKRQFRQTVKYMNKKGTAGILAKLEQRKEVIYIAESKNKQSKFNSEKKQYIGILHWECLPIIMLYYRQHQF